MELSVKHNLLLAAAASGSRVARQEAMLLWSQAQTLVLAGYRGIELAENGDPAPAASLIQRRRWGVLNQRIFELATDIGGPEALDPELPFASLLLASRGWTIGGGTTEIQRNMLAERVLGLPKELKAIGR